jgi:uncharacterized protein YcbK (DUF882 family)
MMLNRRRLVLAGTALAGAAVFNSRSVMGAVVGTSKRNDAARRIALYNLHTDEHLEIEYFRDDAYLPEPLAQLQVLLRDFRTGEQHAIDPKLLDYLVDVAGHLGRPPSFSVISGYRSPQTNEHLHEVSSGVAQHSLHMQGRAIDVRMTGVDCDVLAAGARELMRGGVGYYRVSSFVHMDTGACRTWNG